MKNIKLTIAYDGSRYKGWEHQKGLSNTIQGKIEEVLERLAGEYVEILGAGRTDAGVHARAMCANFKTGLNMTPEEIGNYMNRYLPEDICITRSEEVSEKFHARYNATGKTYRYSCYIGNTKPVFERKYVCNVGDVIDWMGKPDESGSTTGNRAASDKGEKACSSVGNVYGGAKNRDNDKASGSDIRAVSDDKAGTGIKKVGNSEESMTGIAPSYGDAANRVYSINIERMRRGAAYLCGTHDFASFCGNAKMKKSTVRTVDGIDIARDGELLYITYHGTGFLQYMVRIMTGTLLEVGYGSLEPEDIPGIIEAKNRKRAGFTAPACGLCLMKVDYE